MNVNIEIATVMGSPSAEVELLTIDGIASRNEGIRTICKTPEIPEGNILVECDFEVFGHVQGKVEKVM